MIEWMHQNCKNGVHGQTVIADGNEYFYTYAEIEQALFCSSLPARLPDFNVVMKDTYKLICALRDIASWDKQLLLLRSRILQNISTIYCSGFDDGKKWVKPYDD